MTEKSSPRRKLRPTARPPQVYERDASHDWTGPELMEALAEVVARSVGDRFTTMPLVVPSETFFPEPFSATLGWYKRVTSRFMAQCGLGAYELIVDIFDAGERQQPSDGPRPDMVEGHHDGARMAAWFAGLHTSGHQPKCYFGLDLRLMKEPETLVASMAHEVAHAFRAHHGLTQPAAEIGRRSGLTDLERYEEELTDLTTHALGFGVLTTNAAYLYRQTGGSDGLSQWKTWRHGSAGYLSHIDMSHLLAVTLAHRTEAGRKDDVTRWLEKTQAATVKANLKDGVDLEPFHARLAALGAARRKSLVPDRFEPARFAPHKLDDIDLNAELADEAQENVRVRNSGLPVFRIPSKTAAPFRPFSAGPTSLRWLRVAAVLGAFATLVFASGRPLAIAVFGPPLALLFDAGLRRLYAVPEDLCSEPDCQAVQPETAATCPGCGGTIAGTLASADERLDARDALEDD